jgi:cbb3-type cytochrome c oxidase subunit III
MRSCHGTAGLGDGQQDRSAESIPQSEAPNSAVERVPAEWYRIVTEGNIERFMHPLRAYQTAREDVVAYVWSLSTSKAIIEEGRDLFQSNCASCHGNSGKGDGPESTANLPDFSEQELMAGKSDEELFTAVSNGVSPDMPAFTEQLTEDERWALASYISQHHHFHR